MKALLSATAAITAAVLIIIAWRSPESSQAGVVRDESAVAASGVEPAASRFPFATENPLRGRSLNQLQTAMRGGVLAGTEPDGAWVCAASGGLSPDPRARARMDWYGNQLGRFTADEIAVVLSSEAMAACGSKAGPQAQMLWRAYQDAQTGPGGARAKAEPATLLDTLALVSAHRRQVMGREWGEAFFGAEERLLSVRIEHGVQPSDDPAPLPDAAAREVALRAEQAAWQARIDAVKAEVARIRADGGLSTSERENLVATLVDERFEAAERVRARALIGPGQAVVTR